MAISNLEHTEAPRLVRVSALKCFHTKLFPKTPNPRILCRVGRFLPKTDDEFAWQCSEGHWNKRDEQMCRQCYEGKPEQPEILRELLEEIARKHPREPEN